MITRILPPSAIDIEEVERVKGAITKILPPSDIKIEEVEKDLWEDLSALYYKYGDESQQRAFRNVMHEICEKIKDGKWETIYKKLYRARKQTP